MGQALDKSKTIISNIHHSGHCLYSLKASIHVNLSMYKEAPGVYRFGSAVVPPPLANLKSF